MKQEWKEGEGKSKEKRSGRGKRGMWKRGDKGKVRG